MTKRYVPRHHFAGDSVAKYVKPEDAERLEAVVEAAESMRYGLGCIRGWDGPLPAVTANGTPCDCSLCESARAFDSRLAKLKEVAP